MSEWSWMDRRGPSTEDALDEVVFPQCNRCMHRNADVVTCKAYPNRIPDPILGNEVKHDRVLPGQAGEFVFTAK